MAGLRRFQHDFNGLAVAHLADQDHLGSLSHGGTQCVGKAWSIAVQFPLVDGGRFVVVQELDGVFHRDDVIIFFAIDGVKQHRKRRRLARSCRAGHQHDAIAQLGDVG